MTEIIWNKTEPEEGFVRRLTRELKDLGIHADEHQTEQFWDYYTMLVSWNAAINLTAITAMEEVVTKHFADSASLIKAVPDLGERNIRLIDIGTGAGFPGIPLKILFPDLRVTLMDSLGKRVKFLQTVMATLQLTGCEAVHQRAEDAGRDKTRRAQYDISVSRAVANLSTLSEYCLPLVKKGGRFISYKAGNCQEEVEKSSFAVDKLGGRVESIVSLSLDNGDDRTLITIRKEKETPNQYPRKAGLPSKEPLQ